jgi:transcription antitermination factor NusG
VAEHITTDPDVDDDPLIIEQHPDIRWVVVRTRSRGEKKFAAYCTSRDITHYLPLRRSVKRYKHKVATHLIPIFPGYVFAQLDPVFKPELLKSQLAASVILSDDISEPGLVRDLNDVRIITSAALNEEIFVRPEIVVGREIVIRTGPLTGLTGVVSKLKSKTRISVNVHLVGQSVHLEIGANEVDLEF